MPRKVQNLSELEGFTLGLVWQMGSCTPYQIRRHMIDSPSTQWSGSAGAIYPMMRKLARQRLLTSRVQSTGRRKHKTFSITAQGLDALRRWIGPPMTPETVTVAHDPLRTRARFLGTLPRPQQLKWLQAALETLNQVAHLVQKWEAMYAHDDEFHKIIARSGVIDVKSRQKWLRESIHQIGKSSRARSK